MKNILITLSFVLSTFLIDAQRYLTPIFSEVISTTDILYGSEINYEGETEELYLDFYEPLGDPLDQRPLLVYVHGGGFVDTNQSKSLIHIVAYCDSMARRGYAVTSINYRLDVSISNRAVINAMHDANAAIRFFRANAVEYKIDPDLIFIGGESAGAVTALNSTYINETDEVLYPPTLPMADDLSVEGISGNPGFSSNTKAAMCLCGGTETILGDLLFDTLAIQNQNDPALLLSHGTADQLIHVSKALEVAIRAENIGLPYLFYTLEDAQHCPWFFPLENSWQYLDTMITQTSTFLYAIIQDATSSIDEPDLSKNIPVYPNPSNDFVQIDLSGIFAKAQKILIFDNSGKRYESISNFITDEEMQLDIRHLADGIYFVRIQFDNGKTNVTLPICKITN